MSGPVTFTGLFSGLDTASIVEALMNIERRPLTVLQDRQSETQEKLSVFQDLESRLASLDSAVQTLNLAGTVNAIHRRDRQNGRLRFGLHIQLRRGNTEHQHHSRRRPADARRPARRDQRGLLGPRLGEHHRHG